MPEMNDKFHENWNNVSRSIVMRKKLEHTATELATIRFGSFQ